MQRTNGATIEKRAGAMVSADAIRQSGQTVVEQIRQLGEQARKEGEEVAIYAEEIATVMTRAHEEMASRVAEFMQKCQAARLSMQEHGEALTVIPPRSGTAQTPPGAYDAVEKALNEVPVPKFLTQGPRE
jgi:hypothetical protein